MDRPKTFIQTPRIEELDSLRGFAVLGMLMMNIRVFSGYIYLDDAGQSELWLSRFDFLFNWAHMVFFSSKFYIIFSLLFGVSFALQMIRHSGTKSFSRVFSRRLFFLLLIGLIHLWLIWFGDILFSYAILGYILMFFRKLPDRKLLWWLLLLLILGGFHEVYLLLAKGGYSDVFYSWYQNLWLKSGLPPGLDHLDIIYHGSWSQLLKFNLIGPVLRLYLISMDSRFLIILSAFVLGLWMGRKIIFSSLHKDLRLLKKVALMAWLVGLPLNFFFVVSNSYTDNRIISVAVNLLEPAGYLMLSLAYVASFLILYNKGLGRTLNYLFGAVGKTALSNYIIQSLAGIFIFHNVGAGLGRYMGSTLLTAAVVLVFAVQVLLSKLYLRYFRYGPVEWKWRMLTKGRYIKNQREVS